MSETSRYQIDVEVETQYLPTESAPDQGRYVFAYTITLHNTGEVPARLLSRHWLITDEDGDVQEVRGPGVVGEHPYLRPGESFRYTSGTRLGTAVGSMRGTYQLVADDGTHFDAEIKPFVLSAPRTLH
ncbi:Co2+/Mg2+ efflux protein ApaG [Acidihalobacter ferrooxydans]|uniref:Protein ApaG n=1 Tax=Acidihalobacter ferrooxydans TaxID=1765967 RepID=A0A1P8UIK5_9GAMM|nr:Co2+/Mg2+ efflux protein ApaG [Acidihalobacter ferrooxydans]APZ43666.1 Co2+/Mg2+ efflux protein ApaG [Acidihalobacter ferrooxydans]